MYRPRMPDVVREGALARCDASHQKDDGGHPAWRGVNEREVVAVAERDEVAWPLNSVRPRGSGDPDFEMRKCLASGSPLSRGRTEIGLTAVQT